MRTECAHELRQYAGFSRRSRVHEPAITARAKTIPLLLLDDLETMARAVATLTLALPARPGVLPRASERPLESSQRKNGTRGDNEEPKQFNGVAYEHPIELPQLRHL